MYVVAIEMQYNLLCTALVDSFVHATLSSCFCSLTSQFIAEKGLYNRRFKGREIGRWGSWDAGLAWAESCFSDLTPAQSRCDCVAVEAQRTTNTARSR